MGRKPSGAAGAHKRAMSSFVHLNVHSDYSKGWGVSSIEALCRRAKTLQLDQLALTDTNGVYGLIFFVQTAKEMGITPIVGSELLCDGRRAVLLVKNFEGYVNLCHIISARQCHAAFDLVRAILKRRRGLIIFSDDPTLLKALKRDSIENLFVEISPGYHMSRCHAFSRKSGIPLLATNRVYMAEKSQFRLHRILRAMSLNTKLSRLGETDLCRDYNFLNAPRHMMDQYPHAPEAVKNTLKVAEQARVDWDFKRLVFPRFKQMGAEEAFKRLYRETLDGCRRRYGKITHDVKARVDHEMHIIREKNFAHYFLVVADIVRRAQRSCGRGSAAASIVSYALGITHVDPIGHGLFFERFLNLGRMDPPDIDMDFAWDERDSIIDDIFARYGHGHVAMVANHNGFGARSGIREVAKVFGLTDREIGRVTEKIGYRWHLQDVGETLGQHPKMRGITFEKPWDEILDAACRLQGHFNHLSTHCGGVVITPDEIRRYCPVEISNDGRQILQWEKDSVENAGLVKIDILGNRSLAVIRDALSMVNGNYGRHLEYAALNPLKDPETAKIFYKGDTFGVFYFESPATRQVLTKVAAGLAFEKYLAMDHFSLNVVVTSIIRPASNRSIHDWLSRLKGAPWKPPHPLLGPVLNETLGVMVFQEQLSRAAIHLAGFDPGEADMLRKTVSKKHKEKKLRDFHERFVQGARARGVHDKAIDQVWKMMMGFDGYSFCKPHSASYTLVAYKSAWLRAHYPAEFMAAVISNGGGYYSTFSYISEARRMGLNVLPPHINLSQIKYAGKGRNIRMGLMQLKDLPRETLEAIIHERSKHGPFVSLENFLIRSGPHIHLQDVRILIKGGCLDDIVYGASRSDLVWQALAFYDRKEGKRVPGLFDAVAPVKPAPSTPEIHKPYPKHIMLKHEAEVFGFVLSVHPISIYSHRLKHLRYVRASDLSPRVGKHVTVIGWPVTGKTVHSREGKPMKFMTFEDLTGTYEAVFFPDVYDRFCPILNVKRPYILRGKVEESFSAITLTVDQVKVLNADHR
jgi:error-prone DNA polymerase